MEEIFGTAPKNVLVDMVKLAQKRGMKGEKGDWKDFLKVFDKKFGPSMSDPSRRTPDDLRAFLNTFKEDGDLKHFAKFMKCHRTREQLKQQLKSQESESPVQSLVRLTLEHPQYSMDYSFRSHEDDWLITKVGKKSKAIPSGTLLAVDCEMVLCSDGTEALVKICVVDRDLKVKLHEFVKPNKEVVDYRTHITGVSAEDLDGINCSVTDIQKSMKKMLQSHGAVLVGHSLSNDLQAMKIDHARVIDTAFIFKYGDECSKRKPSLNDLCKSVLGFELRKKGAPHNCVDDACAAMKLVLAKMKDGFDDVIPETPRDVPESEKAKLLIHRIPVDLSSEDLHQFIPGDFTIEMQTNKRAGGNKYSVVAIFKSPQEALDTYENLLGDEEKDSSGRPQKPVSVQLKSDVSSIIYVRKMAHDNPSTKLSAKRANPTEITGGELKKIKTEQNNEASEETSFADPSKEIERLKKLLNEKDQEISRLQNIATALIRKQGL